ncbi:amino acid/polyamine/organocation transporter, APC superfamily [Streptococcus equinus]|uniref:Amino acid/polyamine/organocation transporter, APC superfamily n=1 Tax=Streptococcus equinus TaxID=1335 RepID=A0A1H0M9A7_STREI|nr:amino acid permease [Streptococcus equinus]SDO76710.1 amino acid/polyamine/organocation transporter, APC superfamily [Streptococcus equinus]
MDIFRKTPMAQKKSYLQRRLGLAELIFLGVGSIVGTGIFTITGVGAAEYAGPAITISIIVAAVCVTMSALFFAEFSSRLPHSGGVYRYLYTVFGEYPAWIAGWFMIIEFAGAISTAASGWGEYLKAFLRTFGISLPTALSGPFNPEKGTYIDIIPVILLLCVTALVVLGVQTVLRFNSVLVIFKLAVLLIFIALGLTAINTDNWSHFAPYGFGQVYGGKVGIMAGASLMFFAFLGFESISMAADETKEPEKKIPQGIFFSIGLTTLLYVLVTLVLTGTVHYTKLNTADVVPFVLRSIGFPLVGNFVSIVVILTLVTVCISMMFALSRVIYNISCDGLLPEQFQELTPKSKVPKKATIFVGLVTMFMSGFLQLEILALLVNIVTLAYLILLAFGILKLRKDYGEPKEGEFRTPWVPFLPIVSIVVCLSLMTQCKAITWYGFIISFVLGSLIYFGYGYRHSKLREENKD